MTSSVLVVDDETVLANAMGGYLARRGHAVDVKPQHAPGALEGVFPRAAAFTAGHGGDS